MSSDAPQERHKVRTTWSPLLNAAFVNSLSESNKHEFFSSLKPEQVKKLDEVLWFWLRPEQLQPPGNWRIWLYLGGRGAGKTFAGAHFIAQGIQSGAMRRVGVIGATHNDTRAVMIEGESGLLKLCPTATFEPTNRRIQWPTGAVATVLSADEPDSLRGHQFDGLWLDANIDFVGIDNYMPLADWRDGTLHRDYDANGPTSIHDVAYLEDNIAGGEDYDWFYASASDRDAQIRTPITDGLGKPWVWRAKDLWNWWSNAHYDRPSGSENATPTAWVAGSKPVRFTELGCPAVDKGANQPSVFVDPKSAESALPYYSNGERDDLIQRRFLEAHLAFWSEPANNPVSTHYAGRMVDTDNIYVWCWDARPFPFFPARADIWGDAANYTYGHWLNGRLGAVALSDLVDAICNDSDFAERDASALDGLVTGFALTSTMSARDGLTPLSVAFHFDAVERQGEIVFVGRGRPNVQALGEADLVIADGAANFGFTLERAQETDLPLASRIAYIDADADYRQASVESRRLVALSDRVAQSTLPIVMDQAAAGGIAARLLQDAWVMREKATFALAPSHLALDVTDEVMLAADGRTHRLRLTGIDDGKERAIEAVATDPSLYEPLTGASRTPGMLQNLAPVGRALAVFLDLPLLTGTEKEWAPHVATFASPWPGSVQVLRSAATSNYVLDTALIHPAAIGQLLVDFPAAPPWRWDLTNSLSIRLSQGSLASSDDLSVLGGANVIAVQNASGEWEIVQFADATLVAANQWSLSRLLRGQAGSEAASGALAGARVVLLDGALQQLALLANEATLPFNYLWGPNGKAISDPAFQGAALQFKANGRRPYAPCRLRAAYAANGADLVLGWIRRDRAPSSDSSDQSEIALSEASESYDVEILSASGAVVRTFASVASPSLTYSAAQIASDFPSGLPSPFRFTVYQLSTTYGRGPGTTASVLFT